MLTEIQPDPVERMKHLKSVPLFAELSDEELKTLSSHARVSEHRAGQMLFSQGDPGDELYFILGGYVVIEQRAPNGDIRLIMERGPGDYFGEIALLDAGQRTASASVIADATLIAVPRSAVLQIAQHHREILLALVEVYCRRMGEVVSAIASSTTPD